MGNRIATFDTWQSGYGGALVNIYVSGTTTLAPVFLDEALTLPAGNPQRLLSRSDGNGINFGKFEEPIYTGSAYRLLINSTEETGVVRPALSDLIGEDASQALVTPTGSSTPVALRDVAARFVFAENYGTIVTGDSGSAATNTSTIELAIAALTSGGQVIISTPGIIKVTSFNVPESVVVTGVGIEATSLESILGDKSFTITGPHAGFHNITLDGNNLTTGSTGLYSVGNDDIILDNVLIRRFETNMHVKGGKGHNWINFNTDNAEHCIRLHGDTSDGDGGAFSDLVWMGGSIGSGSTNGADFSYEDEVCQNIRLIGVGFIENTGNALNVNGAQFIEMDSCYWSGNTVNWNVQDDDTVLLGDEFSDNKVISVRTNGGRMVGGKVIVTDTAQEIVLDGMLLDTVAFQLDTPIKNFVHLNNCTEEAVTISGESTKLLRSRLSNNGESFGVTTGNVATKAWSLQLDPGQIVHAVGRVIGKQRNGAGRAVYYINTGAYRSGATLAYDTQTGNFTVGNIVTGQSSGAVGRIITDTDGGVTGTLTLTDITGDFLDNEIIKDTGTGAATANGVLSSPSVSLDTVGVQSIRTAYETDASWNATFVANGPEIELQVTGASAATVEWTANVDVVTT